jgi:FAD/FMN-containing dehydrogenase
MLLGISFVRSDGQIAKAGGRVVKNVAGLRLDEAVSQVPMGRWEF